MAEVNRIKEQKFWLICVGCLWGLLCLVYSCAMVHFTVGDLDYRFMRFGSDFFSSLGEGRFSQFIPQWLFLNNQIYPLLNMLLAFFFLSLAVVMLAKWYGLSKQYRVILPFGALIVFHPYFLTQIYYVYLVLSFFLWYFLIISALMLAERPEKKYTAAAVCCYVFCFGGYIGAAELAVTLLLGKVLSDILAHKPVLEFFRYYVRQGIILTAGVILGYAVIGYCRYKGVVSSDMYNVRLLSFYDVGGKFFTQVLRPWQIMFTGFIYLPARVSVILMVFPAVVLLTGWYRQRLMMTAVLLLLLGYALFMLSYFSPEDIFELYRLHCYSVPFFAAVLYAAVWRNGCKVFFNAVWLSAVILIFFYVRADINAQKVWLLGDVSGMKTVDRIRADVTSQLKHGADYRLITLGGIYSRQKFAGKTYLSLTERRKYGELFGAYLPELADNALFLYEAQNQVKRGVYFIGHTYFKGISNEVLRNKPVVADDFEVGDKDTLQTKVRLMRPFPHRDYLFINGREIYLMFDDDYSDRKELLSELARRDNDI